MYYLIMKRFILLGQSIIHDSELHELSTILFFLQPVQTMMRRCNLQRLIMVYIMVYTGLQMSYFADVWLNGLMLESVYG